MYVQNSPLEFFWLASLEVSMKEKSTIDTFFLELELLFLIVIFADATCC